MGDKWLRDWEDQCVEEWEAEQNTEERRNDMREQFSQKLWLSFQNSATAISQLYRDRCHDSSNGLWVPFQNSASCVTIMYKDALEAMKKSFDYGVQCGIQRRNRDLMQWAKKKRRHVRREDLVGYLCGKNAPVRHRSTAPLNRTVSMGKVATGERPSPRLNAAEIPDDQAEPDLRPFRDALALQRLNGAMSNISVGYEDDPASRQLPSDDDFHCFILEEMSRHCENTRKRSSSSEKIVDSPSRKRSRLL